MSVDLRFVRFGLQKIGVGLALALDGDRQHIGQRQTVVILLTSSQDLTGLPFTATICRPS